MKTKNQRRQKILEKFEKELQELNIEHEKKVKEHQDAGYTWYLNMTGRYFYVESQVNSLKRNIRGD